MDYEQMDDGNTTASAGGFTLSLAICCLHSLIGVFLMGYNTALFNVPAATIRSSAASTYIDEYLWQILNAFYPIGSLVGAAIAGKLSDRLGRKKLILAVSIANILASIITATSYAYAMLLIGRFVTGIAAGIATAVCSTYLNEISPESLRGAIGVSLQLTITLAIVISELLGKVWLINPYWRVGCSIGGAMSIIQLLLSFSLLESPAWLMSQNRRDEAIQVLRKLRGLNYSGEAMMDIEMKPTMSNADNGDKAKDTNIDDEVNQELLADEHDGESEAASLCAGLKQHAVIRRIFFVSLSLHALQQLSGINAVFYYSTEILQSAGVSNVWMGSVGISIANFVAVIICVIIIDKVGRKPLLLLSALGMAICCVGITVSFILTAHLATILWMVGYVILFELGLGPIPWVIVAELTPIEYRGVIVSASQVMNYSANTIIALTTESLLTALENYGFVPFGCVCLVGTMVIFMYVPETKQKSTKQIIDEIDPTYYKTR